MIRRLAATLLAAALLTGCAAHISPTHEGPATARYAGINVHYVDRGANDLDIADALVLVHGWASDHTIFNEQIDTLSESHRVIAIDLPGHGESGKPRIDYTMDVLAGAVAAVMDDADVKRAVLIGHSNGTPVIRQFLRRFPDRTAALVAVDGALQRIHPPETAMRMRPILTGPGLRDFMRQALRMMTSPDLDPAVRDDIETMMMNVPQHVLVSTFDAANDPAIWERTPIDVPLLVIVAPAPMWTDNYRKGVERLATDAFHYETMPGTTHMLFLDDPEGFRAILESFLADIDG